MNDTCYEVSNGLIFDKTLSREVISEVNPDEVEDQVIEKIIKQSKLEEEKVDLPKKRGRKKKNEQK